MYLSSGSITLIVFTALLFVVAYIIDTFGGAGE